MNSSEATTAALHPRLPLPVVMFAAVSLLNEISAQMVAPLIPILLVAVLSSRYAAPIGSARDCAVSRATPFWPTQRRWDCAVASMG